MKTARQSKPQLTLASKAAASVPAMTLAEQRRAWRKQANHLAGLLADESAPAEMVKYLDEGYLELVNSIKNCFSHPEVIRAAWPLMMELRAYGEIAAPSESANPYQRLADVIADLLESPDAPAELCHPLAELYMGLSSKVESSQWQPPEIRTVLPILCRSLEKGGAQDEK